MDYFIKPYLIFLLPLLISGCGNYSSNEDTLEGEINPVLISFSPSEGKTNVVVTTSISLQFSERIKTNTVTTNNSNTNCSGTVQISTDNFSTCTKMSSVVGNSNSNKIFTVTPEANLNDETNYHIRVTNGIIGDSGNNLSGQFTTSQGFTTEDSTPPTIVTISPSDNESSVSVGASISITFSETMETSSVTTNSSDTSCSGSLMVSSDNFSSCIKMSSPVVSNSNKTFSVTTSDNFSYSTTYKIKVSTGVKDTSENSMANTYETSSGFHTDTWSGTQQLGTSSSDRGVGVTVDSSDNIYVTGYTFGGLDGNTNAGRSDIFLIKYNSSGDKQWTKQLGTSSDDWGRGVTVDSSNNIYVTGYTDGDLDGNTNSGSDDIFLVKYNQSGTKQWTTMIGGTYRYDRGYGVTVDSSDNIYVTGHTEGDLDGNTGAGGFGDIFLLKYNSSGDKQWTKQLGTSSGDYGEGVTGDSSNNIYVTGATGGGLDGNTSSGSSDIVLVKYYDNGTKQWTKQLGTSSEDWGYEVTVDSSNNIYVTGTTGGGLDGNANSGGYDIFLVKYNSSGDKQWTKQFGTSSTEYASGVTVDSSNNIYVTGWTPEGLDGNSSAGSSDIFLVKYNSSGTKQWTKQLGTSSDDSGSGVTVDSSDNIYVTGSTGGGLDGNTDSGSQDIFLVKYNSDGVLQ